VARQVVAAPQVAEVRQEGAVDRVEEALPAVAHLPAEVAVVLKYAN
jgi:hypothetical protein